MQGISDRALQFGKYNRYKYNGIEFDSTFGLDSYEAKLRDLDPQIGRWWQVDPKAESMESVSPYSSNFDDPIKFDDPNGDCPDCLVLYDAASDYVAGVFGASTSGQTQELPSLNALGDDLKATGKAFVGVYNEDAGYVKAAGTAVVNAYNKVVNLFEGKSKDQNSPAAKPSSPGKMQKEVEKGQAPKEVDRVDHPHIPGQLPHVHYKDKTSSNNDGTTHDKGNGQPKPSKKTKEWLKTHNWVPPPPPPPKPPLTNGASSS